LLVAVGIALLSLAQPVHAEGEKDLLREGVVRLAKLGLSFREPDQWHRQNLENFTEVVRKFDEVDESRLRSWVEAQGDIPVAVFTKFDPVDTPGIMPTITVVIRQNPGSDFAEFAAMIRASYRSLPQVFNNFTEIVGPTEATVAERQSIRLVFEYDLHTTDGNAYHVKNITLAIPFDGMFVQIGMTEESPPCNAELFDAFVGAIEIAGEWPGD
jgi:hypothetical protein